MVPLLVRLVTVQSPVSFQMQPSPMGFSGICPSGAWPLGASSISRRSVSELSFISRTSPLMTVYSLTAAAIVFCTLMTYMLLRLFSRRAIDPVVRSAEQQKRFITDAGHELKTPLTVITTCLSVLEMETGKNKWIDKIQAQTDKMRDLVNDLVTLSRMDEERPPVIMADFDISAAVAETGGFGIGLSIARSIAEGHRGTIRAESPDGRTIVFTAELK